jgi:hypothetical protein
VAVKPRYGAYVVAAWLGGIIVNLLTYSGFYDIALRDFGAPARRTHPRATGLQVRSAGSSRASHCVTAGDGQGERDDE